MSDYILKIIPTNPLFVPGKDACENAKHCLTNLIPKADEINTTLESEVVFVDQGENFESVSCPFCDFDLTDWWAGEMDKASQTNFSSLAIKVPCCNSMSTLNDLKYEMPAGFARFFFEVRNPNIESLSKEDLKSLEAIIGCELREIRAHY